MDTTQHDTPRHGKFLKSTCEAAITGQNCRVLYMHPTHVTTQ